MKSRCACFDRDCVFPLALIITPVTPGMKTSSRDRVGIFTDESNSFRSPGRGRIAGMLDAARGGARCESILVRLRTGGCPHASRRAIRTRKSRCRPAGAAACFSSLKQPFIWPFGEGSRAGFVRLIRGLLRDVQRSWRVPNLCRDTFLKQKMPFPAKCPRHVAVCRAQWTTEQRVARCLRHSTHRRAVDTMQQRCGGGQLVNKQSGKRR